VTESDAVFSGTSTYVYDAFNRLTSALNTKIGNINFAYDAAGNRTSDTNGSYSYNAADQLTAAPGVSSWSYDGAGNLTGNSSGASISYNDQNQSTSITNSGSTLSSLAYADVDQTERTQAGSSSYASSPLGAQVAKSGGSSTYYVRDNQGNLIGERIGANRYYYLKDGLGSTAALINDSGSTVANRYSYGPYGKTVYKSETVSNPWQFAGGYLDSTGLIKFGTRYYDPIVGRWTQRDPIAGSIGSAGAMNRYTYAGDDPTDYLDPLGTQASYDYDRLGAGMSWLWPGAIIGAAAGIVVGCIIGAIVGAGVTCIGGAMEGFFVGATLGAFAGVTYGFITDQTFP